MLETLWSEGTEIARALKEAGGRSEMRQTVSVLAHTSLESSSLQSVAYSVEKHVMEITFRSGSRYRYFGVSAQTYEALISASSKGRYFAATIRPHFLYQRLN